PSNGVTSRGFICGFDTLADHNSEFRFPIDFGADSWILNVLKWASERSSNLAENGRNFWGSLPNLCGMIMIIETNAQDFTGTENWVHEVTWQWLGSCIRGQVLPVFTVGHGSDIRKVVIVGSCVVLTERLGSVRSFHRTKFHDECPFSGSHGTGTRSSAR